VTPDEQPGAIAQRPRPRFDRPTAEVAIDVLTELLCRRVPRLRIGPQRLETDGVQIAVAAELRRIAPTRIPRPGQRAWRRRQVACRRRRVRISAFVRTPAGQQLVEHGAEGIHIGGGGHRATEKLLGRRVLRGHQPLAGTRRHDLGRSLGEQLGDPEIEQLHAARSVDEDVARLEIAVHDQVAVEVAHRIDYLEKEP